MPDSQEVYQARMETLMTAVREDIRDLVKAQEAEREERRREAALHAAEHKALAARDSERDVTIAKLQSQVTTRSWIGGGGLGVIGAAIAALLSGRPSNP